LGNNYSLSVGHKNYRAPELLLGNQYYDYSVDVWQAGAVFAALIFKKEHFFVGGQTPLHAIVEVLGSVTLASCLKKYGFKLSGEYSSIPGGKPAVPLNKFTCLKNHYLVSDEALDLLSRMLVYDHVARTTAR
jgi:casein kinase II subunit alpha